jgi:hypothetical protein
VENDGWGPSPLIVWLPVDPDFDDFRCSFPLAPVYSQGYRPGVIGKATSQRAVCLMASIFVFSSCKEKTEIAVTETRKETTRDREPKLFATSDERFRDAKPSPVTGETPEGWLALPASQFRLLNYRFGESGLGEVWVTKASGTVLDNVNRWLKQFGAPALDAAGLAALRSVPIAEGTGVWVEAAGDYESGMGSPTRPGFALAGVVSMIDGSIVTVKMVGPKAEVETAKAVLEKFTKGLKIAR